MGLRLLLAGGLALGEVAGVGYLLQLLEGMDDLSDIDQKQTDRHNGGGPSVEGLRAAIRGAQEKRAEHQARWLADKPRRDAQEKMDEERRRVEQESELFRKAQYDRENLAAAKSVFAWARGFCASPEFNALDAPVRISDSVHLTKADAPVFVVWTSRKWRPPQQIFCTSPEELARAHDVRALAEQIKSGEVYREIAGHFRLSTI